MNPTLMVSAIHHGTVIDHIPHGQAIRIIYLLSLLDRQYQMMLGINLKSTRTGKKDLIKIENCFLTEEEVSRIVAFAPSATINLIENFSVIKKMSAGLPPTIRAVFVCPNPACITHAGVIETVFHLSEENHKIHLDCHYCEKTFDRDTLEVRA